MLGLFCQQCWPDILAAQITRSCSKPDSVCSSSNYQREKNQTKIVFSHCYNALHCNEQCTLQCASSNGCSFIALWVDHSHHLQKLLTWHRSDHVQPSLSMVKLRRSNKSRQMHFPSNKCWANSLHEVNAHKRKKLQCLEAIYRSKQYHNLALLSWT